MYHPQSVFSSPPTYLDNNCVDFGIYGIEQNDCYLDLNCIEPTLLPGSQQAYPYTTTAFNAVTTTIITTTATTTTTSTNSNTIADGATQPTSRAPRRAIRKKRSKKDPNEPQKPVSAYALFFRDTQAAIKGRSPNASFGEVSKIVASMWDSLDSSAKNLYKQRTETAKKDYLKKLAVYRAQQISCNETDQSISATSSNLQQQSSQRLHEIGDMTLASLIARPPIDKGYNAKSTSVSDLKNR